MPQRPHAPAEPCRACGNTGRVPKDQLYMPTGGEPSTVVAFTRCRHCRNQRRDHGNR